VDLLSGFQDTNLYTISLDDMLKTSLIYLLSKASKTKSWLWHHRSSYLNFGTLNKLAKDGLARVLPWLQLSSAFQQGRNSGAETPLFEGMLVPQQAATDVDDVVNDDVAADDVNDVVRLQALIDREKVIITEATIREALRLNDAESIDCLPNDEIFTELARMGYEKPSTKLTFYKAFFSVQWKFLIHSSSMYEC
nr:integrase, catalytic region, zinc finger, CCHC-type, peptidase aspartic, catalytic [Tanacetum cinerariifolium]